MSAARLTFLYPHLFRTARLGEPAAKVTVRVPSRKRSASLSIERCPYARTYASSTPSKQSNFKRHGKAVEPQPLSKLATEAQPSSKKDADASPKLEPAMSPEAPPADAKEGTSETPEKINGEKNSTEGKKDDAARVIELGPPDGSTPPATKDGKKHASGPMEAILTRQPLESMKRPPPHLTPPPYVHHFDTYTLVKQLQAGGFTDEQAVTTMKAVRSLLALNLDVAQDGLVSKADVENETYLFKAACSELSTEVRNNRRQADEQLRQQRTLLQNEVDNSGQAMNQEALALSDTVKGMFNDRKMASSEEQKTLDSAIQKLSYKIIIMLNSEAKSEIERLRGVLIRRAILGIIFMVTITLATLQYSSYLGPERSRAAERAAEEAKAQQHDDHTNDLSVPTDAAEILAAN